ncbi:response regulator [Spirosoma lituiforme]|jgi:CheY-like chemotaxis protein
MNEAVNNSSIAPRPTDKKPLLGMAFLVVEDYPLNIMFAKRLLEGWGGQIDVAKDGQQALDLLDPARHVMVLMDLQMPVMDGYESARRMRERGETLPIIALTADTTVDIEQQVHANGMNDILIKPLKADRLLELILAYQSSATK